MMRAAKAPPVLLFLALFFLGACKSDDPMTKLDGAAAVDSIKTFKDYRALNNNVCAEAQRLTFSGGSVSVSGDTSTGVNEYGSSVNCGQKSMTLNGPQRYYIVKLTKGQDYRYSLLSEFSYARMVIFFACGASQINTDCGSNGKTGDISGEIHSGKTGVLFFRPTTDGDYYLAVDSTNTGGYAQGKYTLTIEEFTTPYNSACSKAKALSLSTGKVEVQGTTSGAQNEYGSSIACGHSYYTYSGPQVYYRVPLSAAKSYVFTLKPKFDNARFYVFGNQCDAGAINKDCSSKGYSGEVSGSISPGGYGIKIFSPATSGDFTVAVDSTAPKFFGGFSLTIEEFVPPSNGTCAKAKSVSLVSSKLTIKENTIGVKNEFGLQIKCGGTQPALGPQVYYSLALKSSKSYQFTLTPSFPAHMYLFCGSCAPAQVQIDCSSKGATGDHTFTYSGQAKSIFFSPAIDGTYHVAVDSGGELYYGPFTLDITEK